MNGPTTSGSADSPDKMRRENFFRELERAEWTKFHVIGLIVAVIVGLTLIGGGAGGILLGLLVLAGCVFYVVRRLQGELPSVAVAEIKEAVGREIVKCRKEAIDKLRLDPEEDVIQSVMLVGGAPRPPIEGRIRSLMGPKRNPRSQWLPMAPDPETRMYYYGRYQIHALFALEDGIAFFTRQFDYIDDQEVESFKDNGALVSHYSTNKIYYRKIENVRMTEYCMELQMDSGRSHYFFVRLHPDEQGQGPMAHASARDVALINQLVFEEGQAFGHAINQLRDEWEQRAVPR